MRDYTYEVLDASQSSIKIKVDLAHPELFGLEKSDPEYIIVTADFGDFEPGWNGQQELTKINIPKRKVSQVSAAALESAGEAASSA